MKNAFKMGGFKDILGKKIQGLLSYFELEFKSDRMSEELKTIRLNKVAKEFNVGIASLVEYLAKRGFSIENSPNAKISSEMYDLLANEFQTERKVKEESKKINIAAAKESIVIEASRPEQPKDVESEMPEIFIKNYAKPIAAKIPKPAPEEKTIEKSPENITEKVINAEEAIEEDAVISEKTIKKASKSKKTNTDEIPSKDVADIESSEETKAIDKKETTEEVSDKDKFVPHIKIVDKIDLDSINTKSRPSKKSAKKEQKPTKEENEKKAVQKDADTLIKQEEEITPIKPETDVLSDEPSTISQQNIENDGKDYAKESETPSTEEIDPDSAKKENFIETQYQKLEGVKVQGKIDLSAFEKPKKQPVASSSVKPEESGIEKKKKRKRIKKEAIKIEHSPNPQQGSKSLDKSKTVISKGKKVKTRKEIQQKVAVDENEIEKQIKETLARLNPMGKSKASKHRREKRQNISAQIHEDQIRKEEDKKILKVTEFVTANELATMMNISVNEVISTCMAIGMFVSINQRLDAEAIQLIASEFGFKLDFVSADVVEAMHEIEEEDNPEDLVSRPPVVTIMGHVDHGKTSLLDYIRNTNVIAGEAGGITQHIGAYEVKLNDGRSITFLDTPGHEAFTAMRARGAKITDIAIIVIAADDKIMPQTIEAINHAQAAGVPIIFAINKIDKPAANPDKIKEALAGMNLLVEEWGGKYQSQDISAKKGINVDELLEKVLLEAEILQLTGNPKKRAKGTIIESSLDKGRGYVSKILVQDGTIKVGDIVLAGSTSGKVKAMYNERNHIVKEAGPSAPVLLLGLNGAPQAGDTFNVMNSEKEAKDLASRRLQLQREQGIRTQKHITLEEIGRRIAIGDFKQLNLIVKADVDGSVEALSDSLLKLSTEEVQVNIIHKSVGQITEGDVLLATASNAIIIGFQVRPSMSARKLAEAEEIDIRLYSIIYNAINELKDAIEGMLSPEIEEKIVCNLEIREVFKMTKVGTIAGCMCLDGKINRQTKVRIIRDGIVVYTGKLASLRRFKDDVKEVAAGQDCGLNIENFNDIKVGDIIEGYEQTEVKRKL